MTGYETFGIFQALKLHFTKEAYDFFKYNGKTNISITAFENRKDKYHFYKLSRKFSNRDELISFIVANLIEKDNLWVGDLLGEEADIRYRNRQKVLQALSYEFTGDLNNLFDEITNPNDLIRVNDGDYPKLLTKALQKEIKIETLCIMAKILGFLPMWNKKISDTIRWPELSRKIIKYTAFLPQDMIKYQLILKKKIQK